MAYRAEQVRFRSDQESQESQESQQAYLNFLETGFDVDNILEVSLARTATAMLENPKQLELLQAFETGEIHDMFGGSKVQQRGHDTEPLVFWHKLGTFVREGDGAIIQVRVDDKGVPQVYISPNDPNWTVLPCIQPNTYDWYKGHNPHGTEIRVDFIGGPYRSPPANTPDEVAWITHEQRNKDPIYPIHKIGLESPRGRDSIVVVTGEDGRKLCQYHDGTTGKTVLLHDAGDVLDKINKKTNEAKEQDNPYVYISDPAADPAA